MKLFTYLKEGEAINDSYISVGHIYSPFNKAREVAIYLNFPNYRILELRFTNRRYIQSSEIREVRTREDAKKEGLQV